MFQLMALGSVIVGVQLGMLLSLAYLLPALMVLMVYAVKFFRTNLQVCMIPLKVEPEVYQKPTHTNRYTNWYIQFDSHQHTQVKSSVVQCLANRAIMIGSSKEKQLKELRRIKTVMASNGYPRKFVNKAMAKQIKWQELPDIDKKTG